jgi:hypothetical protein
MPFLRVWLIRWRRMRASIATATFIFCLAGAASGARAGEVRYDWRLEDGAEYDSNPARSEHLSGAPAQPTVPGSPLVRIVASGNLAAPLGEHNALALSGAFGGKWFTAEEARAENVLVAQASASDGVRLAQRSQLAIGAAYYDVFQRRSIDLPDFRSLAPSVRFEQALGASMSASLALGYRWFTFKPDDAFSFSAPTAMLSFRQVVAGDLMNGDADWEWSAGGSVEARGFHGPACTDDGCADGPSVQRHTDHFWIGHAELTRVGSWLLGGGAAVHFNQSNSFGESLLRGLFHVRAVVPLPWQLSLSLRGELVATRYSDPLTFPQPVAGLPSASMEDESRSTARVELARVFDRHLELGARYVFYTSAPTSSTVEYRRQTLLVYLAFLQGD